MTHKTIHGVEFVVDESDSELINEYRWYCDKLNYIYSGKNKKKIWLHRLVTNAQPGTEVDHIDGNPLNNKKSNLRFCTRQQNCLNRGKHVNSSSVYKGVYFVKKTGMWQSHIRHKTKKIHLGTYKNEMEAALAYNKAASKIYGDFARLNEVG